MSNGLKPTNVSQLSEGTLSLDIAGSALPAGVTDEQRLEFYIFGEPATLPNGIVIKPLQGALSTVAPAKVDVRNFIAGENPLAST